MIYCIFRCIVSILPVLFLTHSSQDKHRLSIATSLPQFTDVRWRVCVCARARARACVCVCGISHSPFFSLIHLLKKLHRPPLQFWKAAYSVFLFLCSFLYSVPFKLLLLALIAAVFHAKTKPNNIESISSVDVCDEYKFGCTKLTTTTVCTQKYWYLHNFSHCGTGRTCTSLFVTHTVHHKWLLKWPHASNCTLILVPPLSRPVSEKKRQSQCSLIDNVASVGTLAVSKRPMDIYSICASDLSHIPVNCHLQWYHNHYFKSERWLMINCGTQTTKCFMVQDKLKKKKIINRVIIANGVLLAPK